jgi:DNA-binding MarR family transcriptional regulator
MSEDFQNRMHLGLLNSLELSPDEIDFYLNTNRFGPLKLEELARMNGINLQKTQKILDHLEKKGLYKKWPDSTKLFEPLPPYAALIQQLLKIESSVASIKKNTEAELKDSFEFFIANAHSAQSLKDNIKEQMQIKALKEGHDSIEGIPLGVDILDFNKIQQTITKSFEDLKGTFIDLLRTTMDNVNEKVKTQISQLTKTLEDFWNEALQAPTDFPVLLKKMQSERPSTLITKFISTMPAVPDIPSEMISTNDPLSVKKNAEVMSVAASVAILNAAGGYKSEKNPTRPNPIIYQDPIINSLNTLSLTLSELNVDKVLDDLNKIHGLVLNRFRRSPVEMDIQNWISNLHNDKKFDDVKKTLLSKRIEFWREKIT